MVSIGVIHQQEKTNVHRISGCHDQSLHHSTMTEDVLIQPRHKTSTRYQLPRYRWERVIKTGTRTKLRFWYLNHSTKQRGYTCGV